MERLTRRADYLSVASGIKASAGGFVLQARARNDTQPPRFGFTVAKKVGNAPERNRVRRRLKEMVRVAAVNRVHTGFDYVLIGRRAALGMRFSQLIGEFEGALRRVHAVPKRRPLGTERSLDGPGGEGCRETRR
jgi:ribonuclease P protein component